MNHWLTILTLVPFIGGIIVAGLGAERKNRARGFALATSLVALGGAICLWLHFDGKSGELQFVEKMDWVPSLGIQYFIGVDGLGALMVLLTAIVAPLSILVSGTLFEDGKQTNAHVYYALVLWLQAGLFGTFTALNFFHWFLFWELGLIPAFFLVKLWGGPKRGPAATQFFIYTMVGSVALLLSFLAIRFATGSFDFIELAKMAKDGSLQKALEAHFAWKSIAMLVFFGAFLGFAVKVPVIPFHTWLPAAYSEAPSPVTMLLTGVMSKMGVYGFLRILLPIFPEQIRAVLTPLLWLAVVTVVLSSCAAFAQKDIKRMLAYSSALFLFVALIEKRSGGLRGLEDFGGLRKIVPVFTGLMGIAIFSSLGLPGLNGFVGEFLVFKGVFPLAPWAAAVAVIGILVTAIFLLTLIQCVFCGPLNERWATFPDLTTRERLLVIPSIALMFILGIWPQFILGVVDATVVKLVHQISF